MLLLLAVAVGLFAMHTLGHTGMPGAGPMGGHGEVTAAGPVRMAASDPGSSAIFAGDLPTPAEMPLGVLGTCVAILGGLGALLGGLGALAVISLLAWRRRSIRWSAGRPGVTRFAEAVRGPPGTCLGLAVADRSVLRN
jgi:hypothetical protein